MTHFFCPGICYCYVLLCILIQFVLINASQYCKIFSKRSAAVKVWVSVGFVNTSTTLNPQMRYGTP